MKKLVIAAVLLLLGGAWYSAVGNYVKKPQEYEQLIKSAEEMEAKEIYYDAILNYQAALEYKPGNLSLNYKIAEDYKKLGEDEKYEQTMNEVISGSMENESMVLELADYYLENGDKTNAIALLKEQKNRTGSEALRAKLQTLAGSYTTFGQSYDFISDPCSGFMKVEMDGQQGLTDSQGNVVIWPQYEKIGVFGTGGFAPVKTETSVYYIDQNNYKRRVPDGEYEELGIANQGVIPAKQNGKWGYLDNNLKPITDFIYDAATPVVNSLAAVNQDGKWALIDEKLNQVTEFEFEDVILDDWGFCSWNGVAFVKKQDGYRLVGSDGTQKGTEVFEDARAFASKEPAAVMMEGKWGFVSDEGEIVQECRYEAAGSFSEIGYAPVQMDGAWGYIKENGDWVIEPQFDEAKCFNEKGLAPVMSNGAWIFILLDVF